MPELLTDSPARIIAKLLTDLDLGSLPGSNNQWPVYYDNEPDKPDNCVTVYTTTAIQQGVDMHTGRPKERQSVQIRVRANDSNVSYEKIATIKDTLADPESVYQRQVTPESEATYSVHKLSPGGILGGKQIPNSRRYFHTLNLTGVILKVD